MKLLILILTFGSLVNLYGQKISKLETILMKDFSVNSANDGRWIFYPEKAGIEKVEKTLVKSTIPNYDFYKVTMINYLGSHINQGTCLVLVDTLKSETLLVEPLWYAGINKNFVKLFIKYKFGNKDSLANFMTQLCELMQLGSGYKFIQTSSSDTLMTFDIYHFKGDSYITDGNETNSTINYKKENVWRNIRVEIKDYAIIRFTEINPKTNDKYVIE